MLKIILDYMQILVINVQPKAKSLLKPCPHCGGEASIDFDEYSEEYVVHCSNPKCSWQKTKEEAIKAWNTRC